MLKSGILNPALNELLSRFRHTNTIVIADRGFPFWPSVPTIDLSLIDGIPTVLQVITVLRGEVGVGNAWMAEEFAQNNSPSAQSALDEALQGVSLYTEPHVDFKKRIPSAIGLIRTGDTLPYANIILESA